MIRSTRWFGPAALAAACLAAPAADAQAPPAPAPLGGVGPAGMTAPPAGALNPLFTPGGALSNTLLPSPYPGGMGYSPYYPYYLDLSGGGFLRGAADVIDAQGRYLINRQEALLKRQEYKRSRVETRRRFLEYYLDERKYLPSQEELRQQALRDLLARSLNNPPAEEVTSARSLNSILHALEGLPDRGQSVPEIPLDPEALRNINVARAEGGGNVGVLRDGGKLSWPAAFENLAPAAQTEDLRKKIDAAAREAYNQATAGGKVDPGLIRQLQGAVDQLNARLAQNVNALSFSEYSQAKGFLNSLSEAVGVLSSPDVADFLGGRNVARGRTVQDLVRNMSERGLRFAPATGEEAANAYFMLHRALVKYYNAAAGEQKQP